MSFVDFKFEVLESKEEMDEESTKPSKRKNKETSKKEEWQTQAATETVGAQKLDTETNSTQPKKRRYTKRKATAMRGQIRGR